MLRPSLLATAVLAACSSVPHSSTPPDAKSPRAVASAAPAAAAAATPTATPADPHALHLLQSAPADCAKVGWTDKVTPAHQKIINELMGTRAHRVQHALWHAARGGLTVTQTEEVKANFGPAWLELHPLCATPQADANASDYNPVGEDFLYMHRQMVNGLRAHFVAANLKCVRSWQEVPSTKEAPLPDRDTEGAKSDRALAQLKSWESFFFSDDWLRTHSLSQVGFALEFSIHNNLHMRYATTEPPRGFEEIATLGGAPVPYDGKFPPGWKYDRAGYNWLADPYGAALNPTFWKIHGYVDAMIDRWLKANHFARIATDCVGETTCYTWKGTWIGSVTLNEPGVKRTVAQTDQNVDPATSDFTWQRMRLQRVGVLTGGLRGAPVPAEPTPRDPFDFVVQQLKPNCASAR